VWKSGDHPQRDTDGVSDRHPPSHATEGAAVSVQELREKLLVATAKEEAIQLGVCAGGDTSACRGTIELSGVGEAVSGEFGGQSQSEFVAADGGRSREAV
jgi:hypothetical protein